MEGNGWDEAAKHGPGAEAISGQMSRGAEAVSGQMGQPGGGNEPGFGGLSDAMTSAMVKHFASELTRDSLSLWPQFVHAAQRYFNVSHGYVVRKVLWQLVPTTNPKTKSADGEIGGEKDWSVRIYEGLEVDIEEPDLYIPTMGFVTYLLLCGLICGLQDQFRSDTFSSTITFCMVTLLLETTATKVALVMSGAENAPIFDLLALLGYKYLNLSLQLLVGLFLGWGRKPTGFLYYLLAMGLAGSYAAALWQTLRRLARMQPLPAASPDLHQIVIKCIPAVQLLVWWLLLPHWPAPLPPAAAAAAAPAAAAVAAAAPAAAGAAVGDAAATAATTVAALVATVAPAAGNASAAAAAA